MCYHGDCHCPGGVCYWPRPIQLGSKLMMIHTYAIQTTVLNTISTIGDKDCPLSYSVTYEHLVSCKGWMDYMDYQECSHVYIQQNY